MAEHPENDDPVFALATLSSDASEQPGTPGAAPEGALLRSHIEAFGFSGLETIALAPDAPQALDSLFADRRLSGFLIDRFFARAAAKRIALSPSLGHLTPRARRSGAADLFIREGDGTLLADDLEAGLFEAAFAKSLPNASPCEAHAAILLDPPLGRAEAIRRERARALAQSIRALAVRTALLEVPADCGRKGAGGLCLPPGVDILVNASGFGISRALEPASACLNPQQGLPHLVVETAPRPIRTQLLLQARSLGATVLSGFDLEIERAKAVIEAFLGRPARPGVCACIERDIRLEAENIVLIGMPGCGKTTIGKILAQRLMRRFVDVDELVAQQVGKLKARIYREEGEAFFREKETQAIRALSLDTGLVISTGGGSCLRPVNRMLLGMNGRFIWLKRPLAKLATRDRPIAIERGVAALYEERAPIYAALADREIEVSSVSETVRRILGEH